MQTESRLRFLALSLALVMGNAAALYLATTLAP
jgi:hypothetical protein